MHLSRQSSAPVSCPFPSLTGRHIKCSGVVAWPRSRGNSARSKYLPVVAARLHRLQGPRGCRTLRASLLQLPTGEATRAGGAPVPLRRTSAGEVMGRIGRGITHTSRGGQLVRARTCTVVQLYAVRVPGRGAGNQTSDGNSSETSDLTDLNSSYFIFLVTWVADIGARDRS